MAERRMFAKSVVESDQFMSMPAEVQMLYLHLNMAADDDGFVSNPRTIMRSCGANDDSMKLLIVKKFVLAFDKNDNFVVVIKHWRLNNYIRKDTYRETRYKEFMRELYYDENQSYSLNPDDGHYPCIPASSPASVTTPSRTRNASVTAPSRDSNNTLTQDRIKIGEDIDSLGEGSLKTGKDNNSTPKTERTEEKGSGGKPDENSFFLSDEERKETVARLSKLLKSFNRFGYDPLTIYDMGRAQGISKEELEAAVAALEDKPN